MAEGTHFFSIEDLVWSAGIEPDDLQGSMGRWELLPLNKLLVDRRYQRDVLGHGRRTIVKIANRFDWRKFDPITVAVNEDCPGFYSIIDGQHRAVAARLRGGITEVPCIVHRIGVVEQARVFRDTNSVVTKMTPLQIYHAGIVSGDATAVAIHSVVNSAGVEILRSNRARNLMKAHQTVAVRAIGAALGAYGFHITRDALQALARAGVEGGSMLSARGTQVACGLRQRLPRLSVGQLSDVLVSHDIESLFQRARAQGEVGKSVIEFAVFYLARTQAERPAA